MIFVSVLSGIPDPWQKPDSCSFVYDTVRGRRSAPMMQCSPHDDVAILLKLLLHLIGNLEFTRLVQEPYAFSHCQVGLGSLHALALALQMQS